MESLPLGSRLRVPPHCMRVPREVTHRDAVQREGTLSPILKKMVEFGRLRPYAEEPFSALFGTLDSGPPESFDNRLNKAYRLQSGLTSV